MEKKLNLFKVGCRLFIFVGLAFILTGCSGGFFNFGGKEGTGPAGVWLSTDQGNSWKEANTLLSTNPQANSLAGASIQFLTQDPNDAKAFYATSSNTGLLYTYNRGEGWQGTLGGLGTVRTVSIDPKDKCTIYAGVDNKIYKTIDCNRTWAVIYTDSRADGIIVSILVDQRFPQTVYALTQKGELLRSTDSGTSWGLVFRFQENARQIKMGQTSNKNLYVSTTGGGLYRSLDQGKTWYSFRDLTTKILADSNNVENFYINESERSYLIQTRSGLLRSDNAGKSWTKYVLLTPQEQTVIRAFSPNPRNFDQLYYVMGNTLYRTANNGANWKTSILPNSRVAQNILVDYSNDKTLLLVFGL